MTDRAWVLAREPTDEMLEAAWAYTERATADERMALELCDNKTAFKLKMARRFKAMLAASPPPDDGEVVERMARAMAEYDARRVPQPGLTFANARAETHAIYRSLAVAALAAYRGG